MECKKAEKGFDIDPFQSYEIIKNLSVAQKIIEIELSCEPIISLDCRGVNIGSSGRITLIALGTKTKAYIFDVMACENIAGLLKQLLESRDVLKLMHECTLTSVNLYFQFEIRLVNVFDTEIGKYFISSEFYLSLTKLYPQRLNRPENFWKIRNLTIIMINDVTSFLCPLFRVYQIMKINIPKERIAFFEELCEKGTVCRIENRFVESRIRSLKLNEISTLKKKFSSLSLSKNEKATMRKIDFSKEEYSELKAGIQTIINDLSEIIITSNDLATLSSEASNNSSCSNNASNFSFNIQKPFMNSKILNNSKESKDIETQTMITGQVVPFNVYAG